MATENSSLLDLKEALLEGTRRLLSAIEADAPEEKLMDILLSLKEMELQLLKETGNMLDPGIWCILQRRLENRQKDVKLAPSFFQFVAKHDRLKI